MIFTPTAIAGVWVLEMELRTDPRGAFARVWCAEAFAAHGLQTRWVQGSLSRSERHGTLRGLHYQAPPHAEAKLIRCTQGAIFDVAVDLRSDSPTFRQWFGLELDARQDRMLYIAEGLAHGFQTLADHTEVAYQMSAFYHPESGRGVRWDDPAFAIRWPICPERIMSDRDAHYPDFPC